MSVRIFADACRAARIRVAFEDRCEGRESHTGSLDVADDGTGLVIHELNANLGNTTAGACEGKKSVVVDFIAAPIA
jgi:hypothetical protein